MSSLCFTRSGIWDWRPLLGKSIGRTCVLGVDDSSCRWLRGVLDRRGDSACGCLRMVTIPLEFNAATRCQPGRLQQMR